MLDWQANNSWQKSHRLGTLLNKMNPIREENRMISEILLFSVQKRSDQSWFWLNVAKGQTKSMFLSQFPLVQNEPWDAQFGAKPMGREGW